MSGGPIYRQFWTGGIYRQLRSVGGGVAAKEGRAARALADRPFRRFGTASLVDTPNCLLKSVLRSVIDENPSLRRFQGWKKATGLHWVVVWEFLRPGVQEAGRRPLVAIRLPEPLGHCVPGPGGANFLVSDVPILVEFGHDYRDIFVGFNLRDFCLFFTVKFTCTTILTKTRGTREVQAIKHMLPMVLP